MQLFLQESKENVEHNTTSQIVYTESYWYTRLWEIKETSSFWENIENY